MSRQELVVAAPAGRAKDPIAIDFLFLDLTSCARCVGSDRNLEAALRKAGAPQSYELPANLASFFAAKRQASSEESSCCGAAEQASCCEPSAKASCCAPSASGECGCR